MINDRILEKSSIVAYEGEPLNIAVSNVWIAVGPSSILELAAPLDASTTLLAFVPHLRREYALAKPRPHARVGH